MPVKRRIAKARLMTLTTEQEFELLIGPNGEGRTEFTSDRARRLAWEDHREELLAGLAAGVRPWAWWHYVAKQHPSGGVADHEALDRLGALTPEEKVQIARWPQSSAARTSAPEPT